MRVPAYRHGLVAACIVAVLCGLAGCEYAGRRTLVLLYTADALGRIEPCG